MGAMRRGEGPGQLISGRRGGRDQASTRDRANAAAKWPPLLFVDRCSWIKHTHCAYGRPSCSDAPRSQRPEAAPRRADGVGLDGKRREPSYRRP